MGLLEACAYPTMLAAKAADHTYVRCGGGKAWSCWGGKTGGGVVAGSTGTGSTVRANAIAELDEKAGIRCYLLNGVCHQAANRILIPAQTTCLGARGVKLSTATFGPWGRPSAGIVRCSSPLNLHPSLSGDLSECLSNRTSPSTKSADDTASIAGLAGDVVGASGMDDALFISKCMREYSKIPSMKTKAQRVAFAKSEGVPFHQNLFGIQLDLSVELSPTRHAQAIAFRGEFESIRVELETELSGATSSSRVFASEFDRVLADFQHQLANLLSESEYSGLLGLTRDEVLSLSDPAALDA